MRLHFKNVSMPEGAVLFVYGSRGEKYAGVEGPFTGRGLWGSGDFWSVTKPGDTAIVEYYDPQADGAGQPPFSITELVHVWPRQTMESSCCPVNLM